MAHLAYKVVFFKVVFYLFECLQNYQLLPQDFADSLSSHLSVTLTCFLFILLMTRMFFFGIIECLTPPEWPEPWEKATEAICFTDGTYALPNGAGNSTDGSEWHNKIHLGYYYWIPFIFMGQAMILKVPDFFWYFLCDMHPKQPIETLKSFAFLVGSQELMRHTDEGRVKPESLANCLEQQRWADRLAVHLRSENRLVNFSNWHLFAMYMLFKLFRLAALLGSLFYLQASFRLDSPLFGLRMAGNRLQGVPWEQTELFPRWAYCDVHTRMLGSWNTRVTQCALPLNLLLEQLLLFYWFWLIICASFLLLSAVAWGVDMLPARRRQFAVTFLAVGGAGRLVKTLSYRRRLMNNEKLIEIFTAIDRAFMLRLVEERLGLAPTYLAMDQILYNESSIV